MRKLELLAPAKDLECGKAAIDHGADAVYIGAPHFGARASAGNSLADIAKLCDYAHLFDAKVYVTLNTIVYDSELEQVRSMVRQMSEIGVDAILVQDMAVRQMVLDEYAASGKSPLLHASTQTDNRSIEKVKWLQSLGFRRIVLARELSIEDVSAIHQAVPDVQLEVFVHGALCVCYSGLCYASQYCFKRSANRGECAQFCRMKFDLIAADGRELEHQCHLLSLKDMCQIDNIEDLIQAGATSFKIEGRLKDVGYVKNVVAAYSERLNQIINHHAKEYCRSSRGKCKYTFTPNIHKTFNRGYTTYFANGRSRNIASFYTPKAIGEFVGVVKEVRDRQSFSVSGTSSFSNGDGLCFFNDRHELEGVRVNRAEGNRIFPLRMPASLKKNVRLYRNCDKQFEHVLSKPSAKRKIAVSMELTTTLTGFSLTVENVKVEIESEHQEAKKPQREYVVSQLTKLGETPFVCKNVIISENFTYFVPSSRLSELRKNAVRILIEKLTKRKPEIQEYALIGEQRVTQVYPYPYLYNISNNVSDCFYKSRGVNNGVSAFELHKPQEPMIMQCRYCIRYELGYCLKNGGKTPFWKEPLYLRLADGRTFRLEFDCKRCQMNVYGK